MPGVFVATSSTHLAATSLLLLLLLLLLFLQLFGSESMTKTQGMSNANLPSHKITNLIILTQIPTLLVQSPCWRRLVRRGIGIGWVADIEIQNDPRYHS
jgi:hypothetical protein